MRKSVDAPRLELYKNTLHAAAIASEACVILMDILVLGITWYRTAGIIMLARKVQIDTSLAHLMLRDGELHLTASPWVADMSGSQVPSFSGVHLSPVATVFLKRTQRPNHSLTLGLHIIVIVVDETVRIATASLV